MTVLQLEGVQKRYGPLEVLHGIDLAIDAGELVAVVGPSGSGKTTLLQLMGTLDAPSAGRVFVAGQDTAGMSDSERSALRARQIGFVFQQFFLAPTQSALDNVGNGLLYTGLPRAQRRARAAEALQRVGLGHRLAHRPGELSGGERQRAALARAVVLPYQPTGNLDSHSGAAIVDVLRELHAAGTTIVVITHDTGLATAFPRRISMRDGVIEADS
jgi:putative ABC transport system ATP-binding protein